MEGECLAMEKKYLFATMKLSSSSIRSHKTITNSQQSYQKAIAETNRKINHICLERKQHKLKTTRNKKHYTLTVENGRFALAKVSTHNSLSV
jgi:hypothetical protein